MAEPRDTQEQKSGREAIRGIDLTKLEIDPSSRARIEMRLEEVELASSRVMIKDWLVLLGGALTALLVTAVTFAQIPSKKSDVSFETILIIVGGLVLLLAVSGVVFVLHRRFRARRLKRLESRLSGSDLRAINSFVTRELELLSALGKEGSK
jgi:hypothetical protein